MVLDEKRERRYYKLYYKVKAAAGYVCRFLFGIKKENEIRLPQESCLVVANHTCYFDPLILALCVNRPICFVTGENLLRHKAAAFLAVDVFRSIPCSKGKMSVRTIRDISQSLKDGHYVTMFAEGNITYDGVTASLAPANGKLFKALQCTVVTIAVTGAYQIIPRWSNRLYRGNIRAQRKGVYTKEMLHDMTPEEIVERFNQDLYVEQPAVEGEKACRRSAKGIHYVLYACPECGALGKIRGKGREIRCCGCGKTWKYNEFGKIEGGSFETIWQWNHWQMKFARDLVHSEGALRIATLLPGCIRSPITINDCCRRPGHFC
ncbi:MAG: 1-acyl-sn-glycerol-3-phosphate acyltransferase [Lachnospiraceae bacterium]|nr:1-acyl-sn-glycerol-3-phosphate acyltransferase [Lachnospiraceae bacterium]